MKSLFTRLLDKSSITAVIAGAIGIFAPQLSPETATLIQQVAIGALTLIGIYWNEKQ